MKGVIERTCSLCGGKFKCQYEDEMTKAFAEAWSICPECWKKGCLFYRERKNE